MTFTTTIHEGRIYAEASDRSGARISLPMSAFFTDAGAHRQARSDFITVFHLGGRAFKGEAVSDNQIAWYEVD